MEEYLEREVRRLIKLHEITDPCDDKIGTHIADRLPGAYDTEQEYVEFQQKIAYLVEEIATPLEDVVESVLEEIEEANQMEQHVFIKAVTEGCRKLSQKIGRESKI